ncbi:MAG TPA: hypothetical protein ENH62_01625 [Marinobacter sp.]|nr:hypothetical protein [Marinobacter sp.]
MKERLIQVILSIKHFSWLVIQLPLRDYQVGPADAVVQSILMNKGLEFLWVFPRQSGKDESIGQMLTFLLMLFHRTEASIIHTYPTAQQISVGVQRLENRMGNLWMMGRWWSQSKPTRRGLGKAQCAFFSGHSQAKSEGATANLLLVVNEVQDHDEVIVERRFTPMRSSTNATALYVGTVRTTADYLWRTKLRLEKLEAEDGQQRVFMVSPDDVGAENEHYAAFVAGQVRQRGRQHPIIRTEYFNEPVDVAAGLFPQRRRMLMMGEHPRLEGPQSGEIYVGLIDVGGQDEAATSAFADLQNAGRDYTTLTVCRVVSGQSDIGPVYEVVDVWADQGTRHFQAMPGRPSLFDQLVARLNHWGVVAAVCDFTGLGQGITDALIEAMTQPVFGFDFAKSYGKSRLGNDFLAVVETGRFRYFAGSMEEELSDWWHFFTQCEHCGYELAEGVPIERGLRWEVKASAKVVTSTGDSLAVHDDRLLSAALVAEVDRLVKEGELFLVAGGSYGDYLRSKNEDKN